MQRLALLALLATAVAAAGVKVLAPEDPIDPSEFAPSSPTVSAARYDADCFTVSVFVDGQQVLTRSRGAAQFCADGVILLSECPIFADDFESSPTQ